MLSVISYFGFFLLASWSNWKNAFIIIYGICYASVFLFHLWAVF